MITRLKPFATAAFAVALLCVQPFLAHAQKATQVENFIPHSGKSIFDRLNQQEVVEMTFTADLDSLINVRNTNEYSKAKVSYLDEFGIEQNYRVKVKPRGKFRRRVCDMPPLKFKFSKKQLEAAGLNEHNDLKLVTHCLEDEEFSQSLVLKEYLVYKLYRELTPYSFRTQLVKITYQDKEDSSYHFTQYGFFIEDTDEMIERLGGEECEECFGLNENKYRKSAERIASVFQAMIGNVDWSTKMNRNVKQVVMPDESIVPVPYDFDFSVMVKAPYLRANSELKQSNQLERIFIGQSQSIQDVYSTLSYFRTKRTALTNIIKEFEYLDKAERNNMELYLDSFFKQIYSKESADELLFKKGGIPVR